MVIIVSFILLFLRKYYSLATMKFPKKPGFKLHQSRHCAYITYSVKTWVLKSLPVVLCTKSFSISKESSSDLICIILFIYLQIYRWDKFSNCKAAQLDHTKKNVLLREDTHKKKCFFSGWTTKVLPSLH